MLKKSQHNQECLDEVKQYANIVSGMLCSSKLPHLGFFDWK